MIFSLLHPICFFLNLVSACSDEPLPFADVCFIVDNYKFYGHKVRSIVNNNNEFYVSVIEGVKASTHEGACS